MNRIKSQSLCCGYQQRRAVSINQYVTFRNTHRRQIALSAKKKNPGFVEKKEGPNTTDIKELKKQDGWRVGCSLEDQELLEKGRAIVEIKDRKNYPITIFKHEGKYYACETSSTAFKFPVFDGKIETDGDVVRLEVPLDGTVYDLKTGKVLVWCPKDNFVRNILGSLKPYKGPPLRIFPLAIGSDGNIYVKLSVLED